MVRTLSAAVAACVVLCCALVGASAQSREHDALVAKHAAAHGVPEALVRRVIHIETKGNPRLVSKGNYGLMQIRLGTARAMGYGGGADGLLDADTNMTYAVKYLAGAYRAAGGNHERAIRNYQKGYYYEAKRQGFTPYTVASAVSAGAAAPDPTLVQQEESRRQAIEMQRQAAVQSRLEEQKLAEQQRIAAREAAQQEKIARQQAIEQARIEQKNAIEQQRIAQREAAAQERAARQQARDQQQVVQRQAMLQHQIDRDQARQQQRIEQVRERTREQQQVAQQQAAQSAVAAAAAPRVTPVRRAAADPGYSWYNPMRFFKHPAHQAHPYRPEER